MLDDYSGWRASRWDPKIFRFSGNLRSKKETYTINIVVREIV